MNDTLTIIFYSSAAGFPIIIGGLIAFFLQSLSFKMQKELNHFIVAFGGGALLSAISFVLIPTAVYDLSILNLVLIFSAGTFSFMGLDIISSKISGSISQVISMMMDFIPEALALGASFAFDHNLGLLIAIFIGLQNLPEGYNSYLEINEKINRKKTLMILLCLSFVGIVAALTGKYFLNNNEHLINSIMLFSGGGIMYLIFQDIAPTSKLANHWLPATGASLGFIIGMIGEKILH